MKVEYPNNYGAWFRTGNRTSHFGKLKIKLRNILEGRREFDFSNYVISLIKNVGKKKGHILDVGAGGGAFLNYCKRLGLSTSGLDISEDALRKIAEEGHIPLTWEQLSGQEGQFDLITLHHVLEHLDQPIRRLKKLKHCLKPEGRIVIVVPRIDCWLFTVFGELYNHLDGGRHLIMYSPATLVDVLKQAGFRIEFIHTSSSALNILSSYYRAVGIPKKNNIMVRKLTILFYRIVSRWITMTGRGEILELVSLHAQ